MQHATCRIRTRGGRRVASALVTAGMMWMAVAGTFPAAAQYPNNIQTSDISCHPTDVHGFRFDADEGSAQAGRSVSGVGDVNGDGYEDVVVGAPYSNNGFGPQTGSAHLIYGGPIGFDFDCQVLEAEFGQDTNADLLPDSVFLFDITPGALGGFSVSGAGDVNGDGYDDFLVGSKYAGAYSVGRVSVIFGSPNGIGSAGQLQLDLLGGDINGDGAQDGELIYGSYAYGAMGTSVSGAGDVNGDGYDDIIVGSRGDYGSGAAYLIYGAPAANGLGFPGPGAVLANFLSIDANGDGLSPDGAAFTFNKPFGDVAVAGVGDVNGDGFDDVAASTPYAYTPFGVYPGFNGMGYILFGMPVGSPQFPFPTPLDNLACDNNGDLRQDGVLIDGINGFGGTGYSIFAAGDLDGDGFSDVGITSPNYNGGRADFVFGSPIPPGFLAPPPFLCPGVAATGHVTLSSGVLDFNGDGAADNSALTDAPPSRLAVDGASVGDFNGDGLSDFLVSDPANGPGPAYGGLVYLVDGSAMPRGAMVSAPAIVGAGAFAFEGSTSGGNLGRELASAGDFNGDGFSDFMMGAPQDDLYPYYDSGTARVVYGRPSAAAPGSATYRTHTLAGNAPERGIGVLGNGQSTIPGSHCWLDFPVGNGPAGPVAPSTESITFYRDTSPLTGIPAMPVAGWHVASNRLTPPTIVAIRFHYPEGMLKNVAEGSLALYRSAAPGGPWGAIGAAVINPSRNSVTVTLAYPITLPYFALAGTVADNDRDFRPDSCELIAPLAADTNIILPDSDGDGLLDGQEAPGVCALFQPTLMATNPRRADSDADGFQDRLEMMHRNIFVNGPLVADALALVDSDADRLPAMFDPDDTNPDTDGDKYGDLYEYVQGTDPNDITWHPPLGDLNFSGSVDLVDVSSIGDYNLGLFTPPGVANADTNLDGVIDLGDVASLGDFNLGINILP